MSGLQKWYMRTFEKAGWMMLASAHGNTAKLQEYKREIEQLLECLDSTVDKYTDPDKRHDLVVLHMNVLELQAFAKRCL